MFMHVVKLFDCSTDGEPRHVTLTICTDRIIVKESGELARVKMVQVSPERVETLLAWLDVFGTSFPTPLHIAAKIVAKLIE
jgi:hypothetical protein